ncbi:MAG: phosphoribosylglycinamide formyltransferase [Myxococcaceae bacterium]
MTVRVGVLASGSGTNFQALVEGLRGSNAQVAVLICNVRGAKCLERAKSLGVTAEVLDHKPFGSRDAYDEALIAALHKHQVELICLAGFMRLLTPKFLAAFPQRVINVHPALLPSFPGMHGIKQALDYGAKVTGCTVHFVDEGTDTGPVIAQAAQQVLESDDEASLAARIHADEHRLYVQAVKWFADGKLSVKGRRVHVQEAVR